MENQFDNTLVNEMNGGTTRPTFLKVICIISFVMTGLSILVFAFGSAICFSIGEDAVSEVWDKVVATQPSFANMDPMTFFQEVGKLCLYNFIANIVTLVGLIMMWRLNRMGLFIYAAAELATNFTGFAVDMGDQSSSIGSLVFYLVLDIAFITMYALNLKHMKK